jgi:hypothetical protein
MSHTRYVCANMLRVKNKLFGDPHEILCEDLLLIILLYAVTTEKLPPLSLFLFSY